MYSGLLIDGAMCEAPQPMSVPVREAVVKTCGIFWESAVEDPVPIMIMTVPVVFCPLAFCKDAAGPTSDVRFLMAAHPVCTLSRVTWGGCVGTGTRGGVAAARYLRIIQRQEAGQVLGGRIAERTLDSVRCFSAYGNGYERPLGQDQVTPPESARCKCAFTITNRNDESLSR